MRLILKIALKHLLARKRQSLVSLMGIILGVAFFLAISSLMIGSEKDFIRRLVDNSPHITVEDQFRHPKVQPLEALYPSSAVFVEHVRPLQQTRGIRHLEETLKFIRHQGGTKVAAVLNGPALIRFSGRNLAITMSGMEPEDIRGVTSIENYMIEGSIESLDADPDGIIIGSELARRIAVRMFDSITISTSFHTGRAFRILGIFRTGRASYDESQTFVTLKKAQNMFNQPNRANSLIVRLDSAYMARSIASTVENFSGYKAVSWQEATEDLISTLAIRNTIMYTVVSAVLIVAAFGIYNVISTVVMEKQRDIAILKSMGFIASEIQTIFLIQGILLGVFGCLLGLPLGIGMMLGLMQIEVKPPGVTTPVHLPLDWGNTQFLIAIAFAISASILAAWLPARKAASLQPVETLRGGAG